MSYYETSLNREHIDSEAAAAAAVVCSSMAPKPYKVTTRETESYCFGLRSRIVTRTNIEFHYWELKSIQTSGRFMMRARPGSSTPAIGWKSGIMLVLCDDGSLLTINYSDDHSSGRQNLSQARPSTDGDLLLLDYHHRQGVDRDIPQHAGSEFSLVEEYTHESHLFAQVKGEGIAQALQVLLRTTAAAS